MLLQLLALGSRGCCFVQRRLFSCSRSHRKDVSKAKSNIILMGSPGCGKTTVGRILSTSLGRPVLDIDDDHLEHHWGMSVAQKLDEVGSDGFVEAEGQALTAFQSRDKHVISLTGSNPMHDAGMSHIASTGTVVFLDVPMTDILERLERMKVNRIVGQNDGTSMADILKYRQQFYEKWYDTRVICERNESPESIAGKVLTQVKNLKSNQGYASTRGFHMGDKGFNDVLLQGLAPDGGLIVPQNEVPKMSLGQLSRLVDLPYAERALRILEQWIDHRDLHPKTLKTAINSAYNKETFQNDSVCPVRHLEGNQFIQELFHGPTASFKDIALQLMPQMFMNAVSDNSKNKYLILVATSGDTGGAVLDGFSRHAGKFPAQIGVLVLYPLKGISDIQKQQMVSYNSRLAGVVGVSGSDFDFCQTNVKKAFGDEDLSQRLLKDYNLKISAANSISWGRLLPQVVYHVTSYLDLVKQKVVSMGDEIDICVPTGNFGNILAAYYAKEMGIPIRKLVCASNNNNVVTDFIGSGCYDISSRRLLQTISPAIDILVSSNLERLLYSISGRDFSFISDVFTQLREAGKFHVSAHLLENIQSVFHADWCTEDDCAKTMQKTLKNNDYLMDPHTSIAKAVADRFISDRPMVIASTAHPGKFAYDVLKVINSTGNKMAVSEMLLALEKMCPRPGVHKSLLKTLQKDYDGQKSVCDASYQSIVHEIENIGRNI